MSFYFFQHFQIMNVTLALMVLGTGIQYVNLTNSNTLLVTFANGSTTIESNATVGRTKLHFEPSPPRRVVGYYNSWARYRRERKYLPSNIPVGRYTDIVYSYAIVNDEGEVRYADPWADLKQFGMRDAVALRGQGRVERVLLNIGRWIEHRGGEYRKTYKDEHDEFGVHNNRTFSEIWEKVLTDQFTRNRFVFSAIRMMNVHRFDGLDIECAWSGIDAITYSEKRVKFIEFLTFLRSSVGRTKSITLGPRLSSFLLHVETNLWELQRIVDYVNVLPTHSRFDFFRTVHIQPKYFVKDQFSHYIDIGYNASFMNLGIPLLGRGYRLHDNDFHRVEREGRFSGNDIKDWSRATVKLAYKGDVGFFEIPDEYPGAEKVYVQNEGSWLIVRNDSSIVSYIDVQDVIELKTIYQLFGLGGVTIDSVDLDSGNLLIDTLSNS